jgi:hypothetical protein
LFKEFYFTGIKGVSNFFYLFFTRFNNLSAMSILTKKFFYQYNHFSASTAAAFSHIYSQNLSIVAVVVLGFAITKRKK